MRPELFIPFLLGIGVVVVIALVVIHDRRRCAAIQEKAERLGFSYEKHGKGLFERLKGALPVFSQGHSRRITNVLEGAIDEGEIAIFDYRYTTGHGKHSQTHRHVACLLRAPGMNLPSMEIRPEHWGHKLVSAIGFKDINFDERPDFSKMFRVKSKDETGVRATLTPLFMDYLTAIDKRPCIEAIGDSFLFYRPRKTLKAEQLEVLMGEAVDAFRALQAAHAGEMSDGPEFMGEAMSA